MPAGVSAPALPPDGLRAVAGAAAAGGRGTEEGRAAAAAADPAREPDGREEGASPARPKGTGVAVARARTPSSEEAQRRKRDTVERIVDEMERGKRQQRAEGQEEGGEGGSDDDGRNGGEGGEGKAAESSDAPGKPTKLPYGWLTTKLREDPRCLEHGIGRQDVRNEEKRRKRKRARGLSIATDAPVAVARARAPLSREEERRKGDLVRRIVDELDQCQGQQGGDGKAAEGADEGGDGGSDNDDGNGGEGGDGKAAEDADEGGEGGSDNDDGNGGEEGDGKAADGSGATGKPTKLPYGWLIRKLREDPRCLEYGVGRQDIRNERRRRQRQRANAHAPSDGSEGETPRGGKKARQKTAKAAAAPASDALLEQAVTSNLVENEGQQNDNEKEGSAEEKKKRPRRRRTKYPSGERKPPEFLEAWKNWDRAEEGRGALQAAVEAQQRAVEELRRRTEEAQRGLDGAARRLRDYDATRVQPAKERIIEVELAMDTPWMKKYKGLVAYKAEHGSLKSLPHRCAHDKEFDSLCTWANQQRQRRKDALSGKIKLRKPYEIQMLEDLGFEWQRKDKFDDNFARLVTFKQHHGHCLVPQKWDPDPKLANWVVFMRQEMMLWRRDGECRMLTAARRARLEALGFVWSVFELKWNEVYDRLRGFRERHGHCRVPAGHGPDPDLAAWVARQREEYVWYQDPVERRRNRKCKLLPEKIDKLNGLGFEWVEGSDPPALSEDVDGTGEAGATVAALEAAAPPVALAAEPSAAELEAEEAAAAGVLSESAGASARALGY